VARVVVVGAGLGGLGASLFLARRGHRVILIERDSPPLPDGEIDDDFSAWSRPGVPQARHPHNFLARGVGILVEEAPDLVDALLARGVMRSQVAVGGLGAELDDPLFGLLSRRLVFEALMHRFVAAEPDVDMVHGAVAGLNTLRNGAEPVAHGVRLDDGTGIDADLVVDATGRRSPAPQWLASIGAGDPPTTTQACAFQYYSRFYRLRPGCEFPRTDVPIMTAADYTTVMAFPADNRTFTLTATLATVDPLRKALRDPERLDRSFAAFPITAPFIEVAEPISDVYTMARIENRWRRLVDVDGRALVGGFLLVGDSSLHTNPTFGRGISLAFAQGQHLANTIEEAVAEPVAYVARFEQWTAENLGVWFESQVAADGARIERLEASLRGEHLPPPDDPISRFIAALNAVAQFDPLVARALAKVGHLLITPAELTADREVVHRVMAYLTKHPTIEPPREGPTREGPTREEFEQLVLA